MTPLASRLSSRSKSILFAAYFLGVCLYVLHWLASRPSFGFDEIFVFVLYACFVVWVWRQPSPRSKQRYEVVVSQPDNNPIHLIERK